VYPVFTEEALMLKLHQDNCCISVEEMPTTCYSEVVKAATLPLKYHSSGYQTTDESSNCFQDIM